MSITDRRDGLTRDVAVKRPVRVAAIANLVLSGLQTIDGVALGAGDANLRVLATGQTDAGENGIYNASSGVWERAKDFDGPYDVVKGTLIFVTDGATYGNTVFRVATNDPIAVATTPLAIVHYPNVILADDLLALEGLTGTGLATRTAANTWATRSLAAPAAGLAITNPAGLAGNPTFALANDLAALEALSGTGIPQRTATDTWSMYTASDFVAANRTYYIDPSGSDSNNGLTNTAGGAWHTLQKAATVIATLYIPTSITVTVEINNGTYSSATDTNLATFNGWSGGGAVVIQKVGGSLLNPSNVILEATGVSSAIRVAKGAFFGAGLSVRGVRLKGTTASSRAVRNAGNGIVYVDTCDLATQGMLQVEYDNSIIDTTGTMTISTTATFDKIVDADVGYVQDNANWTITGTVTVNTCTVHARNFGRLISAGNTWTVSGGGSVTGKRFIADKSGRIDTQAGGASFYPGNFAGTLDTGGSYDGIYGMVGFTSTAASTVAVSSSQALAVGRTAADPALRVDTSTASSATGLRITAAASGGGLDLKIISPGSNENLTINALGTGTYTIQNTATGAVNIAAAGTPTVINSESITKPNAPMVFAYNSATDNDVSGNGAVHTCIFDTEIFDRSADYVHTTGAFSAPVTGGYNVAGLLLAIQATADVAVGVADIVASNRSTQGCQRAGVNTTILDMPYACAAIDMDAGDTLTISLTISGMGGNTADFFGDTRPRSYLSITLAG